MDEICKKFFVPFPKEIKDNSISLFYADPPWQYKVGKSRGEVKEYDCLSTETLEALKIHINRVAAKDSVLAMWTTGPKMQEACELIEKWGFRYKTVLFVWEKLYKNEKPIKGLGHYTRSATEFILLAGRGHITKFVCDRNMSQVQEVVRSDRHSEKPHLFADLLVQLFGDVPRLELFARTQKKGWFCWGNQIECQTIEHWLTSRTDDSSIPKGKTKRKRKHKTEGSSKKR